MLYVGRAASVQFSVPAAITFRVIKVDPAATYEGWMWLDGYQLDPSGTAVTDGKSSCNMPGCGC